VGKRPAFEQPMKGVNLKPPRRSGGGKEKRDGKRGGEWEKKRAGKKKELKDLTATGGEGRGSMVTMWVGKKMENPVGEGKALFGVR